MFRNLALSIAFSVASASAIAATAPVESKDWLIGTWVLCEDPDGGPKDSLQFNSNGTGQVISAKGNIQFIHKHSGLAVSLLANANGKAIPVELSATADHGKLLLYSHKTGSTSYYIRTDSSAVAACSVK